MSELKEFKLRVPGCPCTGQFEMVNTTFTVTAEDEESARVRLANGNYDDYECEWDSVDDCEIDHFDLNMSEADNADLIE
jgi:hypothetical protein